MRGEKLSLKMSESFPFSILVLSLPWMVGLQSNKVIVELWCSLKTENSKRRFEQLASRGSYVMLWLSILTHELQCCANGWKMEKEEACVYYVIVQKVVKTRFCSCKNCRSFISKWSGLTLGKHNSFIELFPKKCSHSEFPSGSSSI